MPGDGKKSSTTVTLSNQIFNAFICGFSGAGCTDPQNRLTNKQSIVLTYEGSLRNELSDQANCLKEKQSVVLTYDISSSQRHTNLNVETNLNDVICKILGTYHAINQRV